MGKEAVAGKTRKEKIKEGKGGGFVSPVAFKNEREICRASKVTAERHIETQMMLATHMQ